MFNPAVRRKKLGEFLLSDLNNLASSIKNNCSRTGRALINGENELSHEPILLLKRYQRSHMAAMPYLVTKVSNGVKLRKKSFNENDAHLKMS